MLITIPIEGCGNDRDFANKLRLPKHDTSYGVVLDTVPNLLERGF
jgi:hypothetical protein